MRTRAGTCFLAFIVVATLAIGIRADDIPSTEALNKLFDRGGVSAEFRNRFQPELSPLMHLDSEAAVPKKLPKFDKYVTSYTPSIYANINYQELHRILEDSRFELLPPTEQATFRAEAGNMTTERSSLLARSSALDQEDETLFWESERLTQRANDLNSERDRLNVDVDRFNQFCAGRPLPPGDYQYCLNERGRLDRWKTDLGQRITSHNQEFARWDAKFTPFYAAAAALGNSIQRWDGLIKDLVDRLGRAIARIGQCQDLENEYAKACETAVACDETTGCADLATNAKGNNACAKAAEALNQQCHAGSRQDLSERAKEARNAATACNALFQKKCSHWQSPDTGVCTAERHRQLQDEAGVQCAQPYSCREVDYQDCATLRLNFDNGNSCYAARWQVVQECYEGGDQDHLNHLRKIQIVTAECQGRINVECRPPSSFIRR